MIFRPFAVTAVAGLAFLFALESLSAATPQRKKKPATEESEATPKPKAAAGSSTAAKKKQKPSAESADEPTEERPRSAKKPKAADGDEESEKPKQGNTTKSAKPTEPPVPAEQKEPAPPAPKYAPNATIAPTELVEFAGLSPRVQGVITAALELTKQNLTYTYGSAEPSKGGMDCSGTIYYLLRSTGFGEVPRDSSSQYAWVRRTGSFRAVVSRDAKSFEFNELKPGDLMFWTGTYDVQREIPVSHVMLYLGVEKKTKRRVMFGASDGRTYADVQRWGVSVFDFKMPRVDPANPEKSKVTFIGYGSIPGMSETGSPAASVSPTEPEKREEPEPEKAVSKPVKKATPRPKKKQS